MRPAEDCTTMAQLRVEINALDRHLVQLLAQRRVFIDRAVVLKQREGLPARIGARVEAVIDNVRTEALANGLSPVLVERIWRELIEWSIAREEETLGRTEP